jgi:hypothetical protein
VVPEEDDDLERIVIRVLLDNPPKRSGGSLTLFNNVVRFVANPQSRPPGPSGRRSGTQLVLARVPSSSCIG